MFLYQLQVEWFGVSDKWDCYVFCKCAEEAIAFAEEVADPGTGKASIKNLMVTCLCPLDEVFGWSNELLREVEAMTGVRCSPESSGKD